MNGHLRDTYWQEEILEVSLWLRGEGFDERLDGATVSHFLGLDLDEATAHLERLVDRGHLVRLSGGRFRLSQRGEREGQRLVHGLRAAPPPRPGPCGPTCWCHTTSTDASRCQPPVVT